MTIGRIYVAADEGDYAVETAASEKKNIYYLEDGIETLFNLHSMTYDGTTQASSFEPDKYTLFDSLRPGSYRKKRRSTIQFSRAF